MYMICTIFRLLYYAGTRPRFHHVNDADGQGNENKHIKWYNDFFFLFSFKFDILQQVIGMHHHARIVGEVV